MENENAMQSKGVRLMAIDVQIRQWENGKAPDWRSFAASHEGNGDAMYALFGHLYCYAPGRGWMYCGGEKWFYHDFIDANLQNAAIHTLKIRRDAAHSKRDVRLIAWTQVDMSKVKGAVKRFRSLVTIDKAEFDERAGDNGYGPMKSRRFPCARCGSRVQAWSRILESGRHVCAKCYNDLPFGENTNEVVDDMRTGLRSRRHWGKTIWEPVLPPQEAA